MNHTILSVRPSRRTPGGLLLAALCSLALAVAAFGAEAAKKSFNLSAGDAAKSLKAFTDQSGEQIVYPVEQMRGIKTNAVKGELTPRAALDQMLKDTGLVAVQDEKTGALAVKKDPAPNAPRLAQTDSDQPGQGKVEGGRIVLDTFEVFGSKTLNLDLPRSRDDAQPYVVFGHDQIEQSRALNLEHFFRTRLPMATNLGSNVFGNIALGFQQVNLRGLGSNQTLILVDGRRLPALTTTGSFGGANSPDITSIPMDMIERIEVLPSTASGIYGGGATGGVINIIMRKDYSGGEVTLGYINTFDTDTARKRAALNYSASLRGGATLFTLTASYETANELTVFDRDFTVRARQLIMANNPAFFSSPPQAYTTNIRNQNGANLVLKPQYGGTALNSPVTFVPVGYAGIASDNAAALAANAGRYNLVPSNPGGLNRLLNNNTPVKTFGLGLRQKITPWLEGYANYSRNSSAMNPSSFFPNTGYTLTVAATAPNNPFTTPITVTHPYPGFKADFFFGNTVTQLTGGLVAKLPGEWQAGLDYVWGQSRFKFYFNNPLFKSTYTADVSNGVLDVLRDLNARPLDYAPYLFLRPTHNRAEGFNESLTVRASGPTLRLPAGPVMVSAVVDWQSDRRPAQVFANQNPSGPAVNYRYTPETANDAKSGYVEAKLPLLAAAGGDAKQARLELQLAGRYDSSSATAVQQALIF